MPNLNNHFLHSNGLILFIALLFLTVINTSANDTQLRKVTLSTHNVAATASTLRAQGFDVLEGSVNLNLLEVVVSSDELSHLQKINSTSWNIISIELGRPLSELKTINRSVGAVPTGYSDLAGIEQQMAQIAAEHPQIAKLVDLTEQYGPSTTFENRRLYALKISDNVALNEDEPAVMIVSNHHAREIITPVIALNAMTELTSNYGADQTITDAVDKNEIWIAATWNPDGYNEVIEGDNLWRKNRRVFVDGVGVDQNRNYPQGWSAPCGGNDVVTSQIYRGPAPASEVETQTMIAWSQDQRFAKVIDYHSSGREVLYAYSCNTHPFTDYFSSEAVLLSEASGYNGDIRPPTAEGEHYQWQLAQMGAWTYLIETALSFQPSFASAQNEAEQLWPGILFAIDQGIPLQGLVTDAFTGLPIAAQIIFNDVNFTEGEQFASGQPFGRYYLFAPPDTYSLSFSADGYQTQTLDVEIVAGQASTLNIELIADGPDTDADGVPDSVDNCSLLTNSSQIDVDSDGLGNRCDADFNNDCVINFLDVSALSNVFLQDAPLFDLNDDATVNFLDLSILADNFLGEPGPSGRANICN